MKVALKFGYDGRRYHGYARQPHVSTIENEIIDLLQSKKYIEHSKKNHFQSASRTDKAVSSLGNVLSFTTPKQISNLLENINTHNDIIFYAYALVPDDFYPRYATIRHYRYHFPKNDEIQLESLIQTASLFIGTNNYTNFSRLEPGKNPVRTIEHICVEETEDFILIDFFAQTYLWQQIRRIVSAIRKVQKEKITKHDIASALEKPTIPFDYGAAPADFLLLYDILYPQISFEINSLYKERIKKMESRILNRLKSLVF